MTVADYSDGAIAPEKLRAAGITGVIRYITGGSSGKHITKTEFQALRTAGLGVALVYEGGERTLASTSWDAVAAAKAVKRDCASLGYTGAVYWAVDYDIGSHDWPAVRDNLHDVAGVLTLAKTGLYGSTDAIDWAYRDRVAKWFWQCMSTGFSGGRNKTRNSHAHLWQRRRAVVAGIGVDLNDVLQNNWGQLPVVAPAQTAPGAEKEGKVLTLLKVTGKPPIYVSDGITRRWVRTPAQLTQLQNWIKNHWKNGDGKITTVTPDDMEALGGVLVGPDPEATQPVSATTTTGA